ncbi:SWIM-type domain-containing protein [Citrus sinensis]|uniref:SWIM-type domain-containing protein n=1 Tax=Citrus sinensis TaxID=2711 RepID=A0ACB8JR70_CITSI|nr:SWIM-type domain-containing protein [Citrus sinensis]
MLPLQLHLLYKGERHRIGLIEHKEYTLQQMKNEALKITREHGLTTPESVQLSVTNPRNKLSIIVDSEAVLQAQFAAHDSMEVAVFEATILPTLRPDLPLCGVLQAMLHNCGVQLSAKQITWVNDGGNEPPPRTGGIQGPPTELNENDGHENDDDDVVYSTDGSRIDDTDDDDADDDDQNEDNDAYIMDDARGSSFDDETAEVDPQLLADTSDSDYDLGTTQLKDYIEVHAYKPGCNGKHRLRLGDVFDDVEHFRYVLGEVMVDKSFEITKVYNEPRRFYGKCKISECPWYVMGGKIRGKGGFAIKELQKKHECRQTGKSVAVNSKWIAEKIKSKVVVDPHVKISVLREFMLETYGVRIGDLKLNRARERARKDINGDHARGYEDLFQYAAVIHKYDPGAICKVLCDAVTRPEKVLFQRFFMAFPAQKNALNNGCRPYIGLDGCYLKSKYGGVLLAAVDRQKGLLGAIEITWPTAYHRPCARHIYANFYKEHPGVSLRNLFWRAVSSTKKFDYAIAMEKLKKEKLEAWQWLETELAGFTWSRHEYDKTYKVKDNGYYPARRFIVDLMSRSCDCGYWDLAGIPCTHAMAAISHARHTATEYLPKYFSKEAYLNTYVVMFKPILDKVTWDPCDRPKLFPPEITKKIGRPKKKCALRLSIARKLRAQQGVSGPGESSNAARTSKRTKKVVVGGSQESFIAHGGRGGTGNRGRGGNRGRRGQGGNRARARGDGVRGRNRGQYEADNVSPNPTQGSQASQILDVV